MAGIAGIVEIKEARNFNYFRHTRPPFFNFKEQKNKAKIWQKASTNYKSKGETPRQKFNYINSSEFQTTIANYIRNEIKAAYGFQNFKNFIAYAKSDYFSNKDKKCTCSHRSVTSVEDVQEKVQDAFVILETIVFCIVLLPLCIFAYMFSHP